MNLRLQPLEIFFLIWTKTDSSPIEIDLHSWNSVYSSVKSVGYVYFNLAIKRPFSLEPEFGPKRYSAYGQGLISPKGLL
jgi:hypothetical protein